MTRNDATRDRMYDSMADLLKVLSHPVRLRIVRGLIEQPSNVKEIWTSLDMPQATISQHLALLKSHGVVQGERNGTRVTYSIGQERIRRLIRLLSEVGAGGDWSGFAG